MLDEPQGCTTTSKSDAAKKVGLALDEPLRLEVTQALERADGQLGQVYRLYRNGIVSPRDIVEAGASANVGAARLVLNKVRSVLGEYLPTTTTQATQAAATVRTLLADDHLGSAARQHLVELETTLGRVSNSAEVQAREDRDLAEASDRLASSIRDESGVYVYTYPHYWRHPIVAGTERRLLKVGKTRNRAWSRIREQSRQTGMPEDPLLLRVYVTEDPDADERRFHDLLEAAEHYRQDGLTTGTEWFATTLIFLDAIASALRIGIRQQVPTVEDLTYSRLLLVGPAES